MSVAVVLDDFALAAVPGLDLELAREGALVMRSFRGIPGPHLLRNRRGVAVIGGADRTGLLSRLERATASVHAPVVAILPPGVVPGPELRGPGVVDLVPSGARGVARRIVLMAGVPVVTAGRGSRASASRPPEERRPLPSGPRRGEGAPAPGGGGRDLVEVVAVASSTGGVWVLAAMLRDLAGEGRAVLVAQHMEPEFVPFFAEWLQGASGWPIVVVEDEEPLAPGAVYLPGGGKDLVLDGSVLRAAAPVGRFVPCADRLLASAARLGPAATGVVLSGMGSDGAEGLAALARRGGRALCQAPGSAVVPSMPQSALARAAGAMPISPEALATAVSMAQPDAATIAPTSRR